MPKKKPQLKVKTVTVHEVSYSDLEKFVKNLFPKMKSYSFVEAEECGNDSTHSFILPDDWASTDEDEIWENYKNGTDKVYNNRIILGNLCREGYIAPGQYNVEVCW